MGSFDSGKQDGSAAANAVDSAASDQNTGFGSYSYRTYVLSALTIIYILNFVDRGLLAVVGPELVPELGISDTQFGLLTGFGFALLYTIVGIPLARYADAGHRVWIMTVCVALWSLMTVLCGLATDVTIGSITIGAFWILLMCRVGVGIGEAGCTPPANSLIADYYAPRDRSQALGVYSMGVTLGTMFANLIGGWVTDVFDWRTAFFVVGLPGLLIAAVFKLTVKEPPRGYTDPQGTQSKQPVELREAIRELMTKPAFWWMTAGATVAAFCGYGISSFSPFFWFVCTKSQRAKRPFGLTHRCRCHQQSAPLLLVGWQLSCTKSIRCHRLGARTGAGLVNSLLCICFYDPESTVCRAGSDHWRIREVRLHCRPVHDWPGRGQYARSCNGNGGIVVYCQLNRLWLRSVIYRFYLRHFLCQRSGGTGCCSRRIGAQPVSSAGYWRVKRKPAERLRRGLRPKLAVGHGYYGVAVRFKRTVLPVDLASAG